MKDFKWEINLSCLNDLIWTIHRCRENLINKLWSKNKFSSNRFNFLDRKSVNENLKSTFQGKNIILVPKVCLEFVEEIIDFSAQLSRLVRVCRLPNSIQLHSPEQFTRTYSRPRFFCSRFSASYLSDRRIAFPGIGSRLGIGRKKKPAQIKLKYLVESVAWGKKEECDKLERELAWNREVICKSVATRKNHFYGEIKKVGSTTWKMSACLHQKPIPRLRNDQSISFRFLRKFHKWLRTWYF